jgi:hypothetical protein
VVDYAEKPWPWKPLQHILQAYLEIIDDGKVTTSSEPKSALPEQFYPWEIHQYTQRDIEKAVVAFTRLDAIESRLPPTTSNQEIELPYSDLVVNKSLPARDSFIRSFLSAVPPRHMKFRYIAPGIRIQNPAEFASQPFTEARENFKPLSKIEESTYGLPTLLFRADGANSSPWTRPWFPDGIAQDVPAGLYIEPTCRSLARDFGNESRLLLPFGVSANGYARSSNGIPLFHWASNHIGDDVSEGLYQVYHFSGFLPTSLRSVQVHKVLLNWAERVELADWE